MKLRKTKNTAEVADSEKRPVIRKRKFNWGRYIYIAILLGLGIYFIKEFSLKFLYIKRKGQVLFQKLDVQPTSDIRILKLFVEEGEQVDKGDTLFTYLDSDDNNDGNSVSVYAREHLNLNMKLSSKYLERKMLKEMLASYQEQYQRLKKQVLLDIYLPEKLEVLTKDILETQLKLKHLNREIYLLRVHLKRLPRGSDGNGGNSGNGGRNSIHQIKYQDPDSIPALVFFSTQRGTITSILKKEFEVALKGEEIMHLHKTEGTYVKGFFNQEDLEYLHEGDIVKVRFPDDTESSGLISRISFATSDLPQELRRYGGPNYRSIVADVIPRQEADLSHWKVYYKMTVKLIKRRF